MTSFTSPPRKTLRLSRRKQENEDEDFRIGPNKRLKTDSSNVEARKNFMKACLKVSFDAYKNLQRRFQVLDLQDINNIISHSDKNVHVKQISKSVEQNFKIEIKNNTWYEALEICLFCITPTQHLSANVLKDIVEIMMNAHEDLDAGYTIDYLLGKCQNTLLLHFNMHPPCLLKGIRDCYKKFLTSSMDWKEGTLSNRKEYLSDEGIVSYCFNRLAYEITMQSKNGTLIELQEIPSEVDGVKRLHWKKENLERFELLERIDRIERCMLVLESLIYLLQIDLALWHAKHISTGSLMRSQRPLLAYLLWPQNCLTFGTVTRQCHKIMELFAYYIHMQYPERHIKTISMWMNAVIQVFYMYDVHHGSDYPNVNEYCSRFAKHLHNIIAPLPNTSVLRILKNLQPFFMQHLLGIHLIRAIFPHLNQNYDILYIMVWCVKEMSWSNYPVEDQQPTVCKKISLKPHKLLDYLCRKIKSCNGPIYVPKDAYPKFKPVAKDSQIRQDYLIDILFTTFVAYLEAYNVKELYQTLECYNKNENNNDPISCTSYSVSDYFIKKCRSIVQTLKELLIILKDENNEEPLKKLSDLINVYFS